MPGPLSSVAPQEVPKAVTPSVFSSVARAFSSVVGSRGSNIASSNGQKARTVRSTLRNVGSYLSKKASISNLANILRTRFNIVDPKAANKAAEYSMKATATRQNAELLQMFYASAAGAAATVGVAGVATGPLAPAFLGLSLLLIVLLRQRGMNLELYANLVAIQGEADEMFMIMSVVEKICQEYNIDLDTGTVRLWLTKVTNYIAIIAGPSALDVITANRNNLQKFVTEKTDLSTTLLPQKPTSRWGKIFDDATSFFYRTIAPGEYLRVLIREIIILDIFFGIMMSKFDLFIMEKGEQAKRDWVNSREYQLLKETNKVSSGRFAMMGVQKSLNSASTNAAKKDILAKFLATQKELDASFYGHVTDTLDATKARLTALTTNPELKEAMREIRDEEIEAVVEKTKLPPAVAENVQDVAQEGAESDGSNTPLVPIPGQSAGTRRKRKYRR